MASIPIDPALLAEDAVREENFHGLEAFPPSPEGPDLDLDEDEPVDRPAANYDSSGLEDNDEDAYIDSDEEEAGNLGVAPPPVPPNDAVFKRLAGVVGQSNNLDTAAVDLNAELSSSHLEPTDSILDKPLTRRQTRALPRARNIHKPSYEVQRLVGRANMAYVAGDLTQTLTLYLEVIRHDPYVIQAWTTLASTFEEQGNEEGARQMRFCAAHVEDESDTWRDLARQFRQNGQINQCVYCLTKALRKEGGNDLGILVELASIYRLKKEHAKAIDAFKRILKLHQPSAHDFTFLSSFHAILVHEGKHTTLAATTYRAAFDWHVSKVRQDDPSSSMRVEHILQLVDDLEIIGQLEEAVVVIRRGQRWLQDRQNDRKWDALEDDREFDPPHVTRNEAGDWVPTDSEEDGAERYALEIPLRHRLAVIRLRLGDDEEAGRHITELLTLDVRTHHEMFFEFGTSLLRREMWDKALECFAVINECEDVDDTPDLLYNIAVIQHEKALHVEAIDSLEWVLKQDPSNLRAKYRLAKVLEDAGRKSEALELITEFLQDKAAQEASGLPAQRMPRQNKDKDKDKDGNKEQGKPTKRETTAARGLTKRILENQMQQRMKELWEEVQAAEAVIDAGGEGFTMALDRFIAAAGTMVENFRMARGNFGRNRGVVRAPINPASRKTDLESQARALQDRLERGLGFVEEEPVQEGPMTYIVRRQTDFFGLKCEEWLNLIIKYCAVLMVKNEEDLAMDILEHVLYAGLFYNRRSELALRLTTIACAMRTKQYPKIVDNCRRLSQLFQFRMEPLLLLLGALAGGGEKAAGAWRVIQLQKFIHRDLTIHDDLVQGHRSTYSKRFARWHPIVKIGVSRRLGDSAHYDNGPRGPDLMKNGRGVVRDGSAPTPGANGKTNGHTKANSGGEDGDGDEDDEDAYVPDMYDVLEDGEEEQEEPYDDEGEEDDEEVVDTFETPRPTIPSATLNVIYGQYMLSTRAHQSALFYLFRAYEVTPNEPLISLCIAQAYFGRCTNRQSDNRNHQIATGMAFLSRYRALSGKDPISVEEVEYNFGRSFDHFGVAHLAIEHYERVLVSVQRRMEEAGMEMEPIQTPEEVKRSSLAMKAAHCLIQIYGAVGNLELVKQKAAWLAI